MFDCCNCIENVHDFLHSTKWNVTLCYQKYRQNKINVVTLADQIIHQLEYPGIMSVKMPVKRATIIGLLLLTANGFLVGCVGPISVIIYFYTQILNHVRASEIKIVHNSTRSKPGKTRHMQNIMYYTATFIMFGMPFWLIKRALLMMKPFANFDKSAAETAFVTSRTISNFNPFVNGLCYCIIKQIYPKWFCRDKLGVQL